jgi:hypothetical protein
MSLRSAVLVALAVTSILALAAPVDAQRRHGPDANGDGKISLQEFLAQRGRIFDRIDVNHDGQITKDEVAAFQTHMEAASAGAMIRSGKEREGGGGGQAARLAEMTASGPVTRAQWDALLTRRFQKLDTANTGFITMDQMRQGRRGGGNASAPTAPMSSDVPKS